MRNIHVYFIATQPLLSWIFQIIQYNEKSVYIQELLKNTVQASEKLGPHKNLHKDVYSRFIYNCPNLEEPRCPSVDIWINKL